MLNCGSKFFQESLLNNLERNAIQDEMKWLEKYSILETQLSEVRNILS